MLKFLIIKFWNFQEKMSLFGCYKYRIVVCYLLWCCLFRLVVELWNYWMSHMVVFSEKGKNMRNMCYCSSYLVWFLNFVLFGLLGCCQDRLQIHFWNSMWILSWNLFLKLGFVLVPKSQSSFYQCPLTSPVSSEI